MAELKTVKPAQNFELFACSRMRAKISLEQCSLNRENIKDFCRACVQYKAFKKGTGVTVMETTAKEPKILKKCLEQPQAKNTGHEKLKQNNPKPKSIAMAAKAVALSEPIPAEPVYTEPSFKLEVKSMSNCTNCQHGKENLRSILCKVLATSPPSNFCCSCWALKSQVASIAKDVKNDTK